MSDTDADKKRNKLGYQRISVACGHCRRRKIRCVMAEGDPQNRCQNCIRLQKQCVFYPVDQPVPSDNAGPSRTGSTSAIPSVTGHSPSSMTTSAFDSRFPAVVPLPSNVPQGYTGIPYDASLQAQGADFYRPAEYLGQWSQAEIGGSAQIPIDASYLQGGVASYSPYTGSDSMHSTPTDTRSYSFPGPEDSQQRWQQVYAPPGRAMSYGNLESMQTTYAQGVPPGYTGVPVQPMGQQYVPQLDVQSAQIHQMSGPQSAPAGVQMQQYMTSATPQSYPPQGAWYSGQNYEQYGGSQSEGMDNSRRNQR